MLREKGNQHRIFSKGVLQSQICILENNLAAVYRMDQKKQDQRLFNFKKIILFNIVLAILCPLHFHIRFRITSSTSVKMPAEIFLILGIMLIL